MLRVSILMLWTNTPDKRLAINKENTEYAQHHDDENNGVHQEILAHTSQLPPTLKECSHQTALAGAIAQYLVKKVESFEELEQVYLDAIPLAVSPPPGVFNWERESCGSGHSCTAQRLI